MYTWKQGRYVVFVVLPCSLKVQTSSLISDIKGALIRFKYIHSSLLSTRYSVWYVSLYSCLLNVLFLAQNKERQIDNGMRRARF